MTTVLAVDVGNTNVVLGVYENAKLKRTWRLATVHDRTEDELAVAVDALLEQEDLALAELDALVVGSVVPPLTQAFTRLSERYLERPAFIVGPGIKTGVRLRVDNPAEVGAASPLRRPRDRRRLRDDDELRRGERGRRLPRRIVRAGARDLR
jgi:type III pantothenate kinase